MSQQRDDSGRFTPTVSLEEVLDVFGTVEGPVVTSGDVAERTGCSRDSARRKLQHLHEQGILGRRKTAGRVVYWRYETEPNAVDPDDPLWEVEPFASGTATTSENVDEILYGRDEGT